jgi:ATP-dependent protease ClpP protease subunit
MSKRHNLFAPQALERPANLNWDAPSRAVEAWAKLPTAAASDEPAVIEIFDYIGFDPFMGGFGAANMSAALAAADGADVVVKINSPGGDFFEGVTIYNQLREYPAAVAVKVMGIAASAASIIAMAGDEIEMGLGSTMMIHNAWGMVVGNQHDLAAASDTFAKFDEAMAAIYAARTGLSLKKIAALMDAETMLSADDAVSQGFADAATDDEVSGDVSSHGSTAGKASAKKKIDALLAKDGVPRSERRKIFRELTGTQDAADDVTPSADELPRAELMQLLETLQKR